MNGSSLAKYTVDWVRQRAETMKSRFSDRESLMNDMEALYLLDVWEGSATAEERRVTSPRGMMVVEAMRALLFTRRPVLEVPPSQVQKVSEEAADAIEKYLYGAWDQMRVYHAIDKQEWYATCLGEGWMQLVYDPETPRGELPLVTQVLDPRTMYYEADPRRPFCDLEVAQWTERTRREVLNQWGSYPGMGDGQRADDAWLSDKVEYIDFWATEIIEVEEEEQEEEEPLGVLGRAFTAIKSFLQPTAPEEEEGEREGDTQRNKRLKRVVVNCVLVEGEWLKEPVIVPGYERVPFYHWAGISTPLAGTNGGLSVLYPIAGGRRENDAQGLIATENELISMQLRIVEQHAAAAVIVNDESLAVLDATPGAINVADRPDAKIQWVVPPGPGPEIGTFLGQLNNLTEQASLPGALMGQYQAAVSGVALSMLTNPVLMRIAARQREREEVLQEFNKGILSLTEEYAPREGWAVWGRDKQGRESEAQLQPGQIDGYRRNRVHLSARLPKDAPSEILALTGLIRDKLMSRRTGIERSQQILDLAGQSPSDEMKQIMIEDILFGNEAVRKALSAGALQEYDTALAALAVQAQQPAAPPGGMPPGAPPGAPPGPMGGMPPEALPPQALPEAVGLQNMPGMIAMQQGPPGPFPGRPPRPPGG